MQNAAVRCRGSSIGGPLKSASFFALLAAGTLLLSGCGGPSEPSVAETAAAETVATETPAAETTDPSEATVEPVAETEKVSLFDSCMTMFGDDGFVAEAVAFLADVESLNADTAAQAEIYATQYAEVEASAEAELAGHIREARGTYEALVQAWEDRSTFYPDTETYESAKDNIIDLCMSTVDEPAAPELPVEDRVEAAYAATFLTKVRTAHPNLDSFPDEDLITTAENFCLVYGKEGGASVVEQMIVAAAGAKYSEEELRLINRMGVFAFCAEHVDKLS